jgi:hypothetical protein
MKMILPAKATSFMLALSLSIFVSRVRGGSDAREGQHVYVPVERREEIACVQECAERRQLPSLAHCRLACRSMAASELVLERKRRDAGHTVTHHETRFFQDQIAHVSEIISLLKGGEGERKGRQCDYLLKLVKLVYLYLLRTPEHARNTVTIEARDEAAAEEPVDCQDFAAVLESVPDSSINTLSHYEAAMHTCACFYVRRQYARAAAIYWKSFNALPSLEVPLDIIRQIPLAEDIASSSTLNRDLSAIMVVLTSNSTRDLSDLRHALYLLDKNGGGMSLYPLLILHDGLSPEQTSEVLSWRGRGKVVVEFVRLRDEAYEAVFEARNGTYYQNRDKAYKATGEGGLGRGYMHMIRLYSGMLFQHPVLHAFSHYIRFDTDSFFIGPIQDFVLQLSNATEHLRQRSGHESAHVSYGYWWITSDSPIVTEGVWDATKEFMNSLGLTGESFEAHRLGQRVGGGAWNLEVFYNNLELVRTEWIRGRVCSDYYRYIDWNILWFQRRWSDAVVRSMQVFMTLQHAETLQLRVSYKHQDVTICEEVGSFVYLIRDVSHPEDAFCTLYGKRIEKMNRRLMSESPSVELSLPPNHAYNLHL